jgi:hypothetical protein
MDSARRCRAQQGDRASPAVREVHGAGAALQREASRGKPVENHALRAGAIAASRLLARSRIIRLGLLPRAHYWTSVRAVELRCESTWRLLSGRSLSGRLLQFSSDERLSGQDTAADGPVSADDVAPSFVAGSSRAGSSAARAYSSIGQSPRLITGLFLVRTQVGPLALYRRAGLLQRSSSEPFRSTVFPDTMFPRTTFRSRRRINTLPIENSMRRPTSL